MHNSYVRVECVCVCVYYNVAERYYSTNVRSLTLRRSVASIIIGHSIAHSIDIQSL